VSIPPPGWAPAPAVATAGAPAYSLADLRAESRRKLDSRRVGARLVDWLILSPLGLAAYWAFGWHLGTYAVWQCLLLIYHHVFEVTSGATPGKRLFGLRVARVDDGELPRPRQAAARGVIGIFEFGFIAAIVIVCNRGRRRLGDFAAGTAVVDARKHPVLARPVFRGALAYPLAWAAPALVACVLGARGEIPGSYRWEADAICAKTGTALAPTFAAYGVQGMVQLVNERNRRLEALDVPALWQGRHDELMRRLNREAAYLTTGYQDASQSAHPKFMWAQSQRQVRRLARVDGPAIAELGYRECSR
jgi:uncharacterized RDD family membrane protein YckC